MNIHRLVSIISVVMTLSVLVSAANTNYKVVGTTGISGLNCILSYKNSMNGYILIRSVSINDAKTSKPINMMALIENRNNKIINLCSFNATVLPIYKC